MGWAPEAIEVVDTARGHRAARAQHREGCTTLVGHVTLGQGGIILSSDVTRLARTCSDWYPRLALWSDQDGVSADGDGRDDPATANGRLLLGLQGTRSAWARHPIRARRTAGRLTKAARGARALTLPTGFAREAQGRGQQEPPLDVPARLPGVFETCVPRRSASTVLEVWQAAGRRLPRRDRGGAVGWTRPTIAALLAILQHPASAGACT